MTESLERDEGDTRCTVGSLITGEEPLDVPYLLVILAGSSVPGTGAARLPGCQRSQSQGVQMRLCGLLLLDGRGGFHVGSMHACVDDQRMDGYVNELMCG